MHHGCHLAVFSVNVVLACHFMTLRPYRNACGIGYARKNYLKWWVIQLAIHSTVDVQMHYEQLQNRGEVHASVCFPFQGTILQIIRSGIPKYL